MVRVQSHIIDLMLSPFPPRCTSHAFQDKWRILSLPLLIEPHRFPCRFKISFAKNAALRLEAEHGMLDCENIEDIFVLTPRYR